MLLSCNATDRAEVHNLPTLGEESRDGWEKVGKMRCVVAESGTAKNMTGTSSVLCALRDVFLGDSTDELVFAGVLDDIRMECCWVFPPGSWRPGNVVCLE